MISDDLARALAILPWFMISTLSSPGPHQYSCSPLIRRFTVCLIGLGAAFRYMQRRATHGSVDCAKWAYFSSRESYDMPRNASTDDCEVR